MNTASGWTAGAAEVPFPVAVGTPLAGYAARTGPALGTLDPLAIGALVLERDGARLAIVAADVVGVDEALVPEISAATGLGRGELLLLASHTHSGPAGVVARLHPASPSELDPDLRTAFVAAAARAIEAAARAAEPVTVEFAWAEDPGVAANRNDPDGPRDGRVGVLATRRGDDSLQSMLVHVACHPTVLGAESRQVSADFPGALRAKLADSVAKNARRPIVLFANGAAGDVSTRFTRRGQDAAEVARVGSALAEAAEAALGRLRAVNGALGHERVRVALPARSPHDAPPEAINQPDDDPSGRIAETRAQGAAMLAALRANPAKVVPTSVELAGWAVGDLVLIGVPGELFAALGLRIGVARPGPTLVVGYANGYVGYFPDRDAYAAGTYEALASPYAPGCGERVTEAAIDLVRRLGGDADHDGGANG